MTPRFIGLILFGFGFWFIGQNIIFTTQFSFFSFRGLAAGGSVLAILGGMLAFVFGGEQMRIPALVSVAVGMVIVLVSGTVIITPTSMAEVFVGFAAMAAGSALIVNGEINL